MLYVPMGFNGVFVVDVSDPLNASVRHHIPADTLLSGSFHAIGNVAMLSNAGTTLTRFYDISDPAEPREIVGSAFQTVHPDTDALLPYYFANVGGKYALFAVKGNGGGPMLYDITDPTGAQWVDYYHQPDAAGGYIFRHEDYLFEGEGDYGGLYDMSQPDAITEVGRFSLAGDLDTVTPIGNTAVVSVDHGAGTTSAPPSYLGPHRWTPIHHDLSCTSRPMARPLLGQKRRWA